jgi:hypothetical protein
MAQLKFFIAYNRNQVQIQLRRQKERERERERGEYDTEELLDPAVLTRGDTERSLSGSGDAENLYYIHVLLS